MIYPILRDLLFNLPPEKAHHFSMYLLQKACKVEAVRKMIRSSFAGQDGRLQKEVFGLSFRNPVGLGAGFDKNALYLKALETLGFGFVEVGTVTPKAQPGNPQPRLFRLPKDKALINRMGFNNDGVDVIRRRLEQWRNNNTDSTFITGGNIGKNKVTPNEQAWQDYVHCFNELYDVADYFTVNVSSPNTPGLRALQEKDSLRKIFGEIQNRNQGKTKPKPVLLKIAPDLNREQLDDIVSLALEINLSGLVATNTTISREGLTTGAGKVAEAGAGGLSGLPVQAKATEVVSYLCQHLAGRIPVIASGGIFTGADAREKLSAGAVLVQVWTGFIYQGPGIAGDICKGLKETV